MAFFFTLLLLFVSLGWLREYLKRCKIEDASSTRKFALQVTIQLALEERASHLDSEARKELESFLQTADPKTLATRFLEDHPTRGHPQTPSKPL